jgi:menaquinone-specific isochorismate synthase
MLEMVAPIPEKIVSNLLQRPEFAAKRAQGIIVSYSLPWPKLSLVAFLRQAPNAPRFYWANENGPISFAGYDVTATLTAQGPSRFQSIQQQAAQLFEQVVLLNPHAPTITGPRLFGGFSFRAEDKPQSLWSAFSAARFMLPRYQLSHFKGSAWLTINYRLEPKEDLTEVVPLILEEIGKLRTATTAPELPLLPQPEAGQTLDFEELTEPATWNHWVADFTRRIRCGELDKVVLARARRLRTSRPLEVTEILARLERSYPGCYRFLFEPIPGHAFYGATPELLAEVAGSTLRTAALASSIRRGGSPEEDEALGQQLLANPKERLEHALVVEAVRESLQPLTTDLRIASEPDIYRLSNIQHLRTAIEADLREGCGLLPIVEALHPTPALGGRPRQAALPLIQQAEPVSRGWYGAPIGWLDHQNDGMFVVAIRSAISVGTESLLYAGAGIVADSIPEKEWQETQLKFKPLMDALTGVNNQ